MAQDARISEIFYYFESHTSIVNGRTVGRKIGVIQEILIKKYLLSDQKIRDCLIYEPRLRGRSGATHKVEFVLFAPLAVVEIGIGNKLRILDPSLEIRVRKIDHAKQKASISVLTGEGTTTKLLSVEQAFQISVACGGRSVSLFVKLIDVGLEMCRISVLSSEEPLASLESKRVGAQRFSGSDVLGSGIQTIEKAKQTSLVAIDFDLKYNEKMLVSANPQAVRRFRSFAVLGNGVHWTDHDLSVLGTYVDYTFQVKDDAIIRYSEFVNDASKEAGQPFFEYFMKYFNGMTNTPLDAFLVAQEDFILLRPLATGTTLTDLVRMQLPDYLVSRG